MVLDTAAEFLIDPSMAKGCDSHICGDQLAAGSADPFLSAERGIFAARG